MAMSRMAALAIAALVAAALLAGCGPASPSQSGVTYARYQFSCCDKSATKQTWQPGSTVDLHWIVQNASPTTISKAYPVTLSAYLLGAFVDVPTLKKVATTGGTASRIVTTPLIATNDRNAVAPVSTFVLAPDLPFGYYNLTFKVDSGEGNWYGGSGIVQVGP